MSGPADRPLWHVVVTFDDAETPAHSDYVEGGWLSVLQHASAKVPELVFDGTRRVPRALRVELTEVPF